MKKYERPDAVVIDEVSEGVYAASGETGKDTGDCWTVKVRKDQDDAGGYCTFRVNGVHSRSVTHISTASTITITFDKEVTNAEFEGFDVSSISGKTVKLVRQSHANAYYAGDQFDTLLKIWSPDYKTIQYTDATIKCTKTENVQGGFD